MKILFLIRSLNQGGTELQLLALAPRLKRLGHEIVTATFYNEGPIRNNLQAAGIFVHTLDKRGRWDVAGFFWRFVQLVRRERPDVLHGLLGIPNVVAALAKPFLPRLHLVWGVRASDMDLSRYDWLVRLAYRLECALARFADLIIVNSRAGMQHAIEQGFPAEKMMLISNGIDTERFVPDRQSGKPLRVEWGIEDHQRLIGLVARLDPMKDHPTFLRAAALLAKDTPAVRFVCVGDGDESYTRELHELGRRLGLEKTVIWAGARQDMPAVYNALDMACLSSSSEGHPNAVGEAMACGIPCVVTDAGDSAWIVGDTGFVVPLRDSPALCSAWLRLLSVDVAQRAEMGSRARKRILEHFSVATLTSETERALTALVTS